MSPQKKVGLFLFLTFTLSLFSYVPIIRAGTLSVNGGLFVLIIMWSPGLAAILTQLISAHTLRGLGWHFGSARWLGLAYILPIIYALPVYAFTWFAGLGVFPNPARIASLAEKYSSTNLATILTIFILTNATVGMLENLISALGEEIGWRGLLMPELAKMTSFTKTALISGVIWAIWHMPAVLLADYNNGGSTPVAYSAKCFAVMIIAISFPFAWLTLKSGSLWPAVVLHASHNLFIQAVFDGLTGNTRITPYIIGEFGIGLVLTSIVGAYVFWHMQREKPLQVQPVHIHSVIPTE